MNRTTLSLSDEVAYALKREARRRHLSVSAVAREVLAERFGLDPGAERQIPFAGIVSDGDPRHAAARMEESLDEILDEAEQDALGRRSR
ncbi:MAG: ribbon-helix-helix protein, CopG family [Solirubrobacterales bacterium]|nr:ribbon-helix-helix protein, CopG family [Solirubrobacterales bacterium]